MICGFLFFTAFHWSHFSLKRHSMYHNTNNKFYFVNAFNVTCLCLMTAECSYRRWSAASSKLTHWSSSFIICGSSFECLSNDAVHHLCKSAAQWPCPVCSQFSMNHSWWGRSKSGGQLVVSVSDSKIWWTMKADCQHWPCTVCSQFSMNHSWWGRSKSGGQLVGSVSDSKIWQTMKADCQSYLPSSHWWMSRQTIITLQDWRDERARLWIVARQQENVQEHIQQAAIKAEC